MTDIEKIVCYNIDKTEKVRCLIYRKKGGRMSKRDADGVLMYHGNSGVFESFAKTQKIGKNKEFITPREGKNIKVETRQIDRKKYLVIREKRRGMK